MNYTWNGPIDFSYHEPEEKSKTTDQDSNQHAVTETELDQEADILQLATEEASDDAPEEEKETSGGNDCDPTQIYLREIGTSPLLSAEEEIHFARLSQKGDLKARNHMI